VIYDYELLEKLRATLASYFGHFRWANTFRLKKSLLMRYGFPIWFERSFSARIRRLGRSLTVITEGERYVTGIKERFPKYRLVAQL